MAAKLEQTSDAEAQVKVGQRLQDVRRKQTLIKNVFTGNDVDWNYVYGLKKS